MARKYYQATLHQFTLFLIASTTLMMFIVIVLITNVSYTSPKRTISASPNSLVSTCGKACANVANPVECGRGLVCGGAPFACPSGQICAEPFVCYNPSCSDESDCNCNN